MTEIGVKSLENNVIPSFVIDLGNGPSLGHFKTGIYEILRTLNKILYYLFIIPYKVVEAKPKDIHKADGGGIEFEESKFRQAIFLLIHLTFHIIQTFDIHFTLGGPSIRSNPEKLFQIATAVTYLCTGLIFTRFFMKPKDGLKCLLSVAYSYYSPGGQSESRSRKMRMVTLGFCLGFMIITIRNATSNLNLDEIPSSPMEFIDLIYEKRQFYMVLGSVRMNLNILENDPPPSGLWKVAVAVTCIFSSACVSFVTNGCDCCFHFIALSFYALSNDFWNAVQIMDSKQGLEQLYTYYRELKCLTEDLNRIVGGLVFVYLVAGIPYYASNFTIFFDTASLWKGLEIFYYNFVYIAALVLAAEGHRKLQELSDYMYRHFSTPTGLQDGQASQLMMSEISSSQIGLKGFGFFTISYSHLGQVTGILVTYIIILLQFQNSSSSVSGLEEVPLRASNVNHSLPILN